MKSEKIGFMKWNQNAWYVLVPSNPKPHGSPSQGGPLAGPANKISTGYTFPRPGLEGSAPVKVEAVCNLPPE